MDDDADDEVDDEVDDEMDDEMEKEVAGLICRPALYSHAGRFLPQASYLGIKTSDIKILLITLRSC